MTRPTRARLFAAVAVASTMLTVGGGLLVEAPPAAADSRSPVPYTDERSSGALTLCDSAGHQLTRGSVSARPFTHLVVGTTRAPSGYDNGQGTASVYGFQPRQGLDAGQWSGELLTGASRFADPPRPAAVALPEDLSLADLVADFPPSWDGLVQLRLVLGAPNQPLLTNRYDSADVRVDGGTWTLVRGGGAPCQGVRAVAVAQLLGVQASPTRGAKAAPLARGIATRSPVAANGANGPAELVATNRHDQARQSSGHRTAALVTTGVLLLGVGGFLARRRRFIPS